MKVTLTTKEIRTAEYEIKDLVNFDLIYQGETYDDSFFGKLIERDNKYFIVWDDGSEDTDLQTEKGMSILRKCWS